MTIYHCSVKAISRNAGRSATAAAAYRAGCEIVDGREGVVHDYTRKRGVESADIVLPDGAPAWATDRSALWNAAETAERRKDACVAREFEVALPSELSPSERRRLAMDFAKEMADREGCAVDVAIHAPHKKGDDRNHHAHILRTTRKVGPTGLTDKLDTEKAGRSRSEDLAAARARWAELVNERLKENGIDASVDHRSLKDQGIDREPTSHLGPAVSAMERRGIATDVVQRIQVEAAERLANDRAIHELKKDLTSTAIANATVLIELGAAINEQAATKERERDEQRIGISVERIGGHLESAGRAGEDARRSLRASERSLDAATGFTASIGSDTQGAVQGAERRITERDDGRVVEAARRQYQIAGDLVQQIANRSGRLVDTIAAAAQHVEGRVVEAKREKLPAKPVAPVKAADVPQPLAPPLAPRYAQALESVTAETLATVPGILPAAAIRQAVAEIEAELQATRQAPDVDLVATRAEVLKQSAYQERIEKADHMDAKAKAVVDDIASMGRVKRLAYDIKGMTANAEKLQADAKLERAQVGNAVELSPEVKAAHLTNGANAEKRRLAAYRMDDIKDLVPCIERGEPLHKGDRSYRLSDGVALVIERARAIAVKMVATMQAVDVEKMIKRAIDVAWKRPENVHELDVMKSRFVIPMEQRQVKIDQAKQIDNQRPGPRPGR